MTLQTAEEFGVWVAELLTPTMTEAVLVARITSKVQENESAVRLDEREKYDEMTPEDVKEFEEAEAAIRLDERRKTLLDLVEAFRTMGCDVRVIQYLRSKANAPQPAPSVSDDKGERRGT